jgi:hypothetical protein
MEHGAGGKKTGVKIENSGENQSKLISSQLLATNYFCVVPSA